MINKLVLFVLIIAAPALFGQYLTYQDMKDLLETASERDDAVKLLEDKGLEEVESSDEDDGYRLYYRGETADDQFYINLIANTDLDVYTIGEFTWADHRWDYYNKIIEDEGYELIEKRRDKGAQIFDYEGDDYEISLSKKSDGKNTTVYKFIMSIY